MDNSTYPHAYPHNFAGVVMREKLVAGVLMRNFTARKVREFLCVQKVAGVLMLLRCRVCSYSSKKSREFLCVDEILKCGSSYA